MRALAFAAVIAGGTFLLVSAARLYLAYLAIREI